MFLQLPSDYLWRGRATRQSTGFCLPATPALKREKLPVRRLKAYIGGNHDVIYSLW